MVEISVLVISQRSQHMEISTKQHLDPIIYKSKTPSQYQYVVIHVLSVIHMSFSIHVILWFVNVKLKSSVFEPKTEISTLKDFDLADRNPHGW